MEPLPPAGTSRLPAPQGRDAAVAHAAGIAAPALRRNSATAEGGWVGGGGIIIGCSSPVTRT